jgi:hypothetical protein
MPALTGILRQQLTKQYDLYSDHITKMQKQKTQNRVHLFLCKNKNCPKTRVTNAVEACITVNKQPDTKLSSAKACCAYSKWAHMPRD